MISAEDRKAGSSNVTGFFCLVKFGTIENGQNIKIAWPFILNLYNKPFLCSLDSRYSKGKIHVINNMCNRLFAGICIRFPVNYPTFLK